MVLGMALVLVGLWIGQNVNFLPLDASANAPIYDELFRFLFSIGTILFLGIVGLVIFSLIKFRRQPGEIGDGIPLEGNLPLEIFWTAVPAILVLFVGLYSYDIYDRMGGMTPLSASSHDHSAMDIQERVWAGISSASQNSANQSGIVQGPIEVTALQFAFLFHYPGADITSGELHVPSGRPVNLRLESKDVIHAFWVPEFRLKQDVIPGQPTILSFTPTKEGRYSIVCAELCGPYHGGMRSTVVVEDPETYDAWITTNTKPPVTES